MPRVANGLTELLAFLVLQCIFLIMGKNMTSIWISLGFGIWAIILLSNIPTTKKFGFKNAPASIIPATQDLSDRNIDFGEQEDLLSEITRR